MDLESERILKEKGVNYRLIELRERAISVEDVIRYSKEDLNREEICKTIIVKDEEGNNYALFLLGNQRIDFSKAKGVIGGKVRILGFEEVGKVTGTEPGAVCPVLLKMPVLVDRRVFEKRKINFGSGNHMYGLEIMTGDIKKLFDFKIVDIAQV